MKNLIYIKFLYLWVIFSTLQAQELPFFPFHNGISDSTYKTAKEQVKLLLDNNYSGTELNGLDSFFKLYPELQKHELKVYTIYFKVDLDDLTQPYDPRFEEVLAELKGSETMFWLHVHSKKYKSSSVENDVIAVPILQEMADLAQRYGIKLMLYPHRWFWVESPDDGIRVAQKVNRRNFGITFNLCHYLSLEFEKGRAPWQRMSELAKTSMPYLFAISLNGADSKPADSKNIWASFIQPLGDGSFDTFRFLKTFTDLGFNGPVGLQCYNIKQEKAKHLKQSKATWDNYMKQLNIDEE